MAKNKKVKAQSAQRSRAKRAAKAKEQAKSRPRYIPPHLRSQAKTQLDRLLPVEDYIFWLCHGANYIASNYEDGTWEPIFPEIYEGGIVEPEEISRRVRLHYQDAFEGDLTAWGGKAKAILGWTVQSRTTVLIYVRETWRRLDDARDEATRPHSPKVWAVFSEVEALFNR